MVEGTCDLTLPPQASWVSNIVFVKNLYQGGAADTVTIKVPSGECLNGVTNGTQALTAGQSAS